MEEGCNGRGGERDVVDGFGFRVIRGDCDLSVKMKRGVDGFRFYVIRGG